MNDLDHPPALSRHTRIYILVVAFLGWGFAGCHLSITSLVMRVALTDLFPVGTSEGVIGQWFGYLVCAFLFGAAAGGYLFGYFGDRWGRSRAMGWSIVWYATFSGLTYASNSPSMLLVLRFLTCMGLGGMWPNGIALVSEAWPNVSRPVLSGIMGTSANVGIVLFSWMTMHRVVTYDDWRWTMLFGATPLVLGILSLLTVPESPQWLSLHGADETAKRRAGLTEIFQPSIVRTTIVGILLGAVPLFGGWGVSNWSAAWASEVGDAKKVSQTEQPASAPSDGQDNAGRPDQPGRSNAERDKPTSGGKDPRLKSLLSIYRALPGSITSLLGGAIAFYLGRRRSYFVLCVAAFACTQILFRLDDPTLPSFKYWTAALGAFSGAFFGWLPLCLPELFPTRVRATGAGVSFNWGRILAGIGVLASAMALREAFKGQYPLVGLVCGYVYLVGCVAIIFAPDTSKAELTE